MSGFGTTSRFRAARGRILGRQIADLAARRGGPVSVLDIGGRRDYWNNVGLDNIARIVVLNADPADVDPTPAGVFEDVQGDACDLAGHADGAFDLAHSNSVIEHVGPWEKMAAMAAEARRVGRAGWVQTPAWEFPVEPHFRAPMLHWVGQPLRRRLLALSPAYRGAPLAERRFHVDRINLVSKAEVAALFPGCEILVERFMLWPKSFVARW